MNVLITGASGFVGKHLAASMRDVGFRVRAAGRRPINLDHVDWGLMPDVTSVDWKKICSGADVIVHLAAIAHTRGVSAEKLRMVNQDAPIALATALDPEQHLIFISSIRAVVGSSSLAEISEATEPQPTCDYGHTKLQAERTVQQILPNSCVLRPVTVYGEGARFNVHRLEMLARSGLPLPIKSFAAPRSYLSVENLCSAIVFMAETRTGGIYNVSDPDTASLAELVAWLRDALGMPKRLFSMPGPAISSLRPFPGMRSMLSLVSESLIARPERLLDEGWQPIHGSTREGVHKWARSDTASRRNYTGLHVEV